MYALRFKYKRGWEEVADAFATYDEAHTLATEISERNHQVAAYLIAADHIASPMATGPKIETLIVHFWTRDSSERQLDFWKPEGATA